ncbi:MAG: MFS transporter [Amaricoccus sp.]
MAYFMVGGVYLPFWPLWLEQWGLDAGEVGLFTALGIGIRVVAGLIIPALADRLDARRHTIIACVLVGITVFVAQIWIRDKSLLLLATLASGAAMAGISPISEALGVAASRVYGFAYAPARGLGSVGFLSANLIVGALIARTGPMIALWWIVGCLIVTGLLAVNHPGGRKVQGQIPPRMGEIGQLVLNPTFAIFVAALSFTQASHAVFYAYGTLHWASLGLSEARIGALWAAGVGTEVLFMVTIGGWVVHRLGAVGALTLSGVAGILRWGLMMTDPTGWLLWPLMAMHALTFAVGHLGAMAFIARAVPQRFGAAAQGAAAAMAAGLILSLGTMAAAALYPTLGGRTYGIGVAMSAIGVLICWWLARAWHGQRLAVE